MSVESTLRSFVVSKEPTALALQGSWGVGKTYLWNERIIKQHLKVRREEKYTYVSLFGINTLDDLKAVVSYVSGAYDSESAFKKACKASPRRAWWWFLRMLPYAAAHAPSKFGGGPALARAISNLSFYALRDRLICIDDVERRGQGLSLKDVLGLVSFLKEQKQCRVCLILNVDALSSADLLVWREQREKILDAEISYEPTPSQSIALGLNGSEGEVWYAEAWRALADLEVKNVRLIRRVVRALTLAFGVELPRSSRGIGRITRDVVVLVYAHSGTGIGAPPLDFVMRYSPEMLAFDSMRTARGEPPTPPEEVQWASILDAYELGPSDGLRRELHQIVLSGFPRPEQLKAEVAALERSDEQQEAKQRFREAWDLYHNVVADNRDQTMDAIESAWREVSSSEHVMNLLAVVGMFRRNGRQQKASEFIDQWLSERSGSRIEELKLREMQLFERVSDEEFLEKRSAFVDSHRKQIGIGEAMGLMAERSYDENAISAIAASSPAMLALWMEQNPGAQLQRAIKCTLDLRDRPDSADLAHAGERMVEALQIIAAKSDWTAARIKAKYGVENASNVSSTGEP